MKNESLLVRSLTLSLLVLSFLAAYGCGKGSGSGEKAFYSVSGTVKDAADLAIAGASVYLVPASLVNSTTITNAAVLSGEAEDYDEPLEDLAGRPGVLETTADGAGNFRFADVGEGKYFLWANPPAGDTEHLPGGELCRIAVTSSHLYGNRQTITLASSPSSNAEYIGSSQCLACHPDQEGHKYTAHAVGFRAPGSSTSLQDISKYPGFDDGLTFFIETGSYLAGTELFFEDFDSTRGFDKFKVFEGVGGGGTVYFRAYLWKDINDGRFKITLVNEFDPSDVIELLVNLTYGGALYKQRCLVKVPGRDGHYPFLQYQHAGDNDNYDRTRKRWRDYHADYFWDDNVKEFVDPGLDKTMEGNCAACHFTGFSTFLDPSPGEWLADAVQDVGGIDFDSDGIKEEINLGCEVCHGPGSEHVFSNPRFITNPKRLTPNRANQICGRCHDRVQGAATLENDQPLNSSDEMMPPGTRRADFLANYTSRKTAAASNLWQDLDALHSKSHHQQFTDFLKSPHSRNSRRLVVCSDCHTLHDNQFDHQLLYSTSPDSLLCVRCHAIDVEEHMIEETGASMSFGSPTTCTSCHMPKTAKSGAGSFGNLIGTPTGEESDVEIVYWENDISSHTFASPTKHLSMGVLPGEAMPVPYNDSCGLCHQSFNLQYSDPKESETCAECHQEYFDQWEQSSHSQLVTEVTEGTSTYCFRCHIGQQFIKEMIAGAGSYSGTLPYPDPISQTCAVCHYPHLTAGTNEASLRAIGQAVVPEFSTSVQANKARLCISCHNSRREDPESEAVPEWNDVDLVWELGGTPHAANQSETFLGIGAVTSFSAYGFDEAAVSDTFHATQNFIAPGQSETQMCLTCHMHSSGSTASHEWEPSIESCAQCHSDDDDWGQWGGAPTPSFAKLARGDYDGDGTVESTEVEYDGLRARVLGALTDGTGSGIGSGFGFAWLGEYPYWTMGTDEQTAPDADAAKAAYTFVLFENDPAAGIHNPAYATQVLRGCWRMLGRKLLGNAKWNPPGASWTD